MVKKKFGWWPQLILLALIIAGVIIVVIRLNKWNSSTVEIDPNIDPSEFANESLDMSFHIDKPILEEHGDDGVNRMLVMGNYMVQKTSESGMTLLGEIKKKLPDWEITDISANQSMIAAPEFISDDEFPIGKYWSPFTLYYLVKGMCTRDYANQEYNKYETGCFTHEDPDEYMAVYEGIDLNDYDVLVLMYASTDYYQSSILYSDADEFDVTTYMGALKSSIKMLQECYPHLRIVVSSPFLTYSEWEGERCLGSLTNFGSGTEAEYAMREYLVCTEYCVSFVDNYFSFIDENNIDEYVDYTVLTDKGVDAVSDHFVEFMQE